MLSTQDRNACSPTDNIFAGASKVRILNLHAQPNTFYVGAVPELDGHSDGHICLVFHIFYI